MQSLKLRKKVGLLFKRTKKGPATLLSRQDAFNAYLEKSESKKLFLFHLQQPLRLQVPPLRLLLPTVPPKKTPKWARRAQAICLNMQRKTSEEAQHSDGLDYIRPTLIQRNVGTTFIHTQHSYNTQHIKFSSTSIIFNFLLVLTRKFMIRWSLSF